jgi:hypothetical protein
MKRLLLIPLVVASAGCLSPVFRNPEKVLDEIHADVEAGRHEEALEKLLWFHENATKHDDTWSGVRMGNIHTWYALALEYPPAMNALIKARDEAEANVRADTNAIEYLDDCEEFNYVLGEDERTRELFGTFVERHPDSAWEAYLYVEPALLRLKDYALCGQHFRPELTYRAESGIRSRSHIFDADIRDAVEKDSKYRLCLTVAILALNKRSVEAEEFARKSRALWDDFEFHTALDHAIEGIVPEYPADPVDESRQPADD